MITAHAVNAATGRSRRRTDVDVLERSVVGVNGGTREELRQRLHAARDVAADEVRVMTFHLRRRHLTAREYA